jgi:hypothetical protein
MLQQEKKENMHADLLGHLGHMRVALVKLINLLAMCTEAVLRQYADTMLTLTVHESAL